MAKKQEEENNNLDIIISEDEQDIINKLAENEDQSKEDLELEDLIQTSINEIDEKKFKNLAWWSAIPKRDRYRSGDVVYHIGMDRFGIFLQPCRKEGLVRLKVFKLRSKTETYTRDWYIDFDDVVLVKRGTYIRPEFVETPNEFAKRAGRSLKSKEIKEVTEAAL